MDFRAGRGGESYSLQIAARVKLADLLSESQEHEAAEGEGFLSERVANLVCGKPVDAKAQFAVILDQLFGITVEELRVGSGRSVAKALVPEIEIPKLQMLPDVVPCWLWASTCQ